LAFGGVAASGGEFGFGREQSAAAIFRLPMADFISFVALNSSMSS